MELNVAGISSQSKANFHANRYVDGILQTQGEKNFSSIARNARLSHDQVRRDLQVIPFL